MKKRTRVLWISAALFLATSPLRAQEKLSLFLDCAACDFNYLRAEIRFVDYVSDRADADVHLLVTTKPAGSGGQSYELYFFGLRSQAGKADTIFYFTSPTDTEDEVRGGLARKIALGLLRYLAGTPLANRITIGFTPDPAATPQRDPWNFWVFTAKLGGSLSGESSASGYRLNGRIFADRVTEDWKFSFELGGSREQQRYTYYDSKAAQDITIRSLRTDYDADAVIVKSLGPHFSAGLLTYFFSSTYENVASSISLMPAVEYNFFPYRESTRRQFTVQYAAGVRALRYFEETLFGHTRETRPAHVLWMGYGTKQPWGSASASLEGRQYLHDPGLYRLIGSFDASIRIVRGLSLDLYGNYQKIGDQLAIPLRDATSEEALLRLRELRTNHRYTIGIGLSYRFGSLTNNIVNPRFEGR